jgi:hypothetical protein
MLESLWIDNHLRRFFVTTNRGSEDARVKLRHKFSERRNLQTWQDQLRLIKGAFGFLWESSTAPPGRDCKGDAREWLAIGNGMNGAPRMETWRKSALAELEAWNRRGSVPFFILFFQFLNCIPFTSTWYRVMFGARKMSVLD